MKAEAEVRVPLVDLSYQHDLIADEVAREWQQIIEESSYIGGSVIARFEEAFARFSGVGYCVGVANGTDAVELCLRAAGIGPGDEVILPTNSFVATAFAVNRAGGRPVLVDVDDRTLLIDPAAVGRAMTGGTRGVIPVHLFGQLAPTELIEEVVGQDVTLIEDAAQAQGATRFGRGAGSFGVAAAMSFYPSKNLGAYGDAGCVLTRSEEFAARIRAFRNHGGESKNVHPLTGFNSRLDSLQAAVLLAKLRHLANWNQNRRKAADFYDELLQPYPEIGHVPALEGNEHIWYVYVVRVPNRNEVLTRLNDAGIGAQVHYPIPIHLQEPFRLLGYGEGDFPKAEAAAKEILSLPLSPGITKEQQQRVVAELIRAAA
jgi:dTDP-4-amino-4,6-dideoxygalactose transaminase